MASVLIVDDPTTVRRSAAAVLDNDGHVVRETETLPFGLDLLAMDFDVVVMATPLARPPDTAALVRAAKERHPGIEVIVVSGSATVEEAVGAMKAGAFDYIPHPFERQRLLDAVRGAAEHRSTRTVRRVRAEATADGHIVAVSRAMRAVVDAVATMARSDSTVLITGESGTGKELVARALHARSDRRTAKFVPINCGAIPDTMLESELFGHRKGAFTSAVSDKKGLLEDANQGVLLLDEVGEMPASMQVRLLRFVENGEIRRIGETQTRRVDVRVLVATHRSLDEEIAHGRFREDFFHRINVMGIHIPPLRDRPEDIVPLAEHLLPTLAARVRRSIKGFTPAAIDALRSYPWPGNVRELRNAIERSLNVAQGDLVTEADLPARVRGGDGRDCAASIPSADRERLLAALTEHHWNQRDTAASLGMSRTTLWRRLRELRIES